MRVGIWTACVCLLCACPVMPTVDGGDRDSGPFGSMATGGGGGSIATAGVGGGSNSAGGGAHSGGGPGCTTSYPSEVDDGGVPSNLVWETVADAVTGLWGASPNDVWAVANRWLIHWDGTAFGLTRSEEVLHSAWGSGAANVWVVGANGTALHWDGTAWMSTQTGTSASLHGPLCSALEWCGLVGAPTRPGLGLVAGHHL